jgi:predicted transcriptional regulator
MKSDTYQKTATPPLPPLKAFGHQLRTKRKLWQMSQQRLAELAGTAQATVALIEAGKVKPNYETLEKIATCLQQEVRLTLRNIPNVRRKKARS